MGGKQEQYVLQQSAENIHRRLKASAQPLIRTRADKLHTHHACIAGMELVSWLVQQGDFADRAQAVHFLTALLEYGFLRPVTAPTPRFHDAVTLYRFKQDDLPDSKTAEVRAMCSSCLCLSLALVRRAHPRASAASSRHTCECGCACACIPLWSRTLHTDARGL